MDQFTGFFARPDLKAEESMPVWQDAERGRVRDVFRTGRRQFTVRSIVRTDSNGRPNGWIDLELLTGKQAD